MITRLSRLSVIGAKTEPVTRYLQHHDGPSHNECCDSPRFLAGTSEPGDLGHYVSTDIARHVMVVQKIFRIKYLLDFGSYEPYLRGYMREIGTGFVYPHTSMARASTTGLCRFFQKPAVPCIPLPELMTRDWYLCPLPRSYSRNIFFAKNRYGREVRDDRPHRGR